MSNLDEERDDQFERSRHGGLYDRGSADKHYGRTRDPHWYPEGTYNGKKVETHELTEKEIAEYNKGYDEFPHSKF
jgi:hypothetical protein